MEGYGMLGIGLFLRGSSQDALRNNFTKNKDSLLLDDVY
jgi:hypothetical protein